MDFAELVDQIHGLKKPPGRPLIIAISGFGGSGKSTLASRLAAALTSTAVIPIDDFIRGPKDELSNDWHTFDRQRLRRDVLIPTHKQRPIRYRQYRSGEWVAGKGGAWRSVSPQNYLIIEGCSVLHPTLMSYYDLSVWIDCPEPFALLQAEERDLNEGNDDVALWNDVWRLNDVVYFNTFHPDTLASIIVRL